MALTPETTPTPTHARVAPRRRFPWWLAAIIVAVPVLLCAGSKLDNFMPSIGWDDVPGWRSPFVWDNETQQPAPDHRTGNGLVYGPKPKQGDWVSCDLETSHTSHGVHNLKGVKTEGTVLAEQVFQVRSKERVKKDVCMRRNGPRDWDIAEDAQLWRGQCYVNDELDEDLKVKTLCSNKEDDLLTTEDFIHLTPAKQPRGKKMLATAWTPIPGFPGYESRCCIGETDHACELKPDDEENEEDVSIASNR